ncbi:major facilitator superfamily domain-containing protein [Mycena sp. CBHHK59/15]|nr:major facilitator superfamily domain-containing protein [Mycena sp. CBHHK59/15]
MSVHEENAVINLDPPDKEARGEIAEQHSIYTSREKWFIVALIAFGGLFSPLSSNIYFPVIPLLSNVFHRPIELINLTVTMYIVFQGISPMFWGTLADYWGRRPMFIGCLLLLSGSCIGLALIREYWLLLLLRCFQAAGSASTIALAIGPVIGGALSDGLGWRSIFWFLCIASSTCALFPPRTLRSMVGNGSITPPAIYRPLLPIIRRKKARSTNIRLPRKPFQNPLRLLLNPDILILLGFNGLICAVFYGVVSSISTVFHAAYPALNETQIGLCFLAIGGGMLLGSVTFGKILDWDYQRVKKSISEAKPDAMSHDSSFPIEKARMRLMPILVAIYVGCCSGYGWCIEKKANIAGPLILLIGVGFLSIAIMNGTQTLILDLVPEQGSSVTACNNLVRCALSAAMVACIQLILTALGSGWTYVLLAGLCVLASPLIYVVMYIGPSCRARRRVISEQEGTLGAS